MITLNGKQYTGKSITVKNGEITIDGKKVTPNTKEIYISVDGSVEKLDIDSCDEIKIVGSVMNITSISGDVKIEGQVLGNVSNVSGDILCTEIHGNASTVSGDINKD